MKALLVVPRLPGTGHTGDRVRAEFHLAALGRLGAEVTLLGGAPAGRAVVPVPGAARVVAVPIRASGIAAGLLRASLTGAPLQAALVAGPWSRALASLPRRFDLVVWLLARLAPWLDGRLPEGPLVLDYIDALSEAAAQAATTDPSPLRRLYWRLEAPRLRAAEGAAARGARLLLATTGSDAAALPAGTIGLPHGVAVGPRPEGERPPRVAFAGRLGYRPNALAADFLVTRVWPLVASRVPGAELVLGGADPPAWLRRRIAAAGARLESPVAEMPRFLRQARVVATPVEMGTGTPNKVYEALEAGAAVVASSAVAARAALDGAAAPVLVADGPEELAAGIAGLLGDAAAAEALGARGRGFVEAHADRRAKVEELAALLRGAAGAP